MKSGIRQLIVGASILIGVFVLTSPAFAEIRNFDIPSQDANKSILEFARQAQIQVLAPGAQLSGLVTASLHGSHDVHEALDLLLRGTGLKATVSAEGIVTISQLKQEKSEERKQMSPTKRNSIFVLLAAWLSAGPAHAQEQNSPSVGAQPVVHEAEQVVVTGTRIVRDGYSAPTPTTVIGAEDIQRAAPRNIADYVNTLPQLSGSTTPRSSTIGSSGVNGLNSLNLRGLGLNRTLVLLDGQRVAASHPNGAVDINNLPSALISRVDIVTGGASAAYGSDAVAGVVNFIVDKEFTGWKGSISGGMTTRADDEGFNAEVAYGQSFAAGRGHFLVSGEYGYTAGVDKLDPTERTWWKSPMMLVFPASVKPQRAVYFNVNSKNMARGGMIATTALAGTQFGVNGQPLPFQFGTISDANYMVGGNTWSEGSYLSLELGMERYALWSRASYDLTDDVTFSLEGSYGYTKIEGAAPMQRYPGTGSTALIMRADNPFLDSTIRTRAATLGITTFNYGYPALEIGLPRHHIERKSVRTVASLNGTIGGAWHWNTYYQYGQVSTPLQFRQTIWQDRFREAIDATRDGTGRIVCRSTLTSPNNGCLPLNIFGIGVADPAAIRYVKDDAWQHLVLDQHVVAASATGEPFNIWAGPVSVAFGVEGRWESVNGTSDPVSQADGHFTANFKPTVGETSVKEGFAEVVVPLIKDLPLAQSLEFNGAVRYTSYSLAGDVTTWKAGLSYLPFEDLRFRAVLSRDIRAPNLSEVFTAGASNRGDVIDTSLPSRPSVVIRTITSGNLDLQPEKANTTSFGAVYSPSWFPQFSGSIDYYNIDIEGAVGTVANQQAVDRCVAGETALCSLIVRDASGTITQILAKPINVNLQTNEGIDYEASFRQDLGFYGSITLRALVTQILDASTINNNVRTVRVGELTGTIPEWRWNYTVTYDLDRLQLSASAHGFSDGVYNNTWRSGIEIDNNEIKGTTYVDLSASYRIADLDSGRVVLFGKVDNVFDTPPELVAENANSNRGTNVSLYDTIGRSFRLGVRFSY